MVNNCLWAIHSHLNGVHIFIIIVPTVKNKSQFNTSNRKDRPVVHRAATDDYFMELI